MWCLCMLLSIHHKYQMGNVRTYGISKYATINCRHGNRCLQNKCHEMRRWQSMSFIIVFFRNWWIHFEYREMEYYDEVMELKNKQPTAVPSVGADIHRTDEEISKTIESIEVRRGRIRFGIFFNQSIRYCIVRMWLDQVLNHRQHHVSPHMNERRESHPNRNRNQRARITQNTQPKVSTTSSGTSWRCRRKLRIYFSTSPGECLPLSLQRMSHADDGAFFPSDTQRQKSTSHTHCSRSFPTSFRPWVTSMHSWKWTHRSHLPQTKIAYPSSSTNWVWKFWTNHVASRVNRLCCIWNCDRYRRRIRTRPVHRRPCRSQPEMWRNGSPRCRRCAPISHTRRWCKTMVGPTLTPWWSSGQPKWNKHWTPSAFPVPISNARYNSISKWCAVSLTFRWR